MIKDARLLAVLDYLRQRLGASAFEIEDYWEADLLAIGIKNPDNPNALAYIALTGEITSPLSSKLVGSKAQTNPVRLHRMRLHGGKIGPMLRWQSMRPDVGSLLSVRKSSQLPRSGLARFPPVVVRPI